MSENTERLTRWLEESVPGFRGPATLTPLGGGQSNPTYRFDAASGAYVLRSKPTGTVLASAHAVDREYRVMSALAATEVPVPETLAFCEDPEVFGAMFYVMRFREGRVFEDPRLPDLSPDDRARVFDSMNAAIAAIHSVDIATAGLDDFGRHGAYVERQIARWTKQYRQSEIGPNPAMEKLIDWLPAHAPQDGTTRLVHGDYRLDNVILDPTRPKIVAVVDWELSTLGSPIADFANHVMTWRFAPDLFRGLAGTDLTAAGIPDEESYVARYFERTGFERPDGWTFYLVLGMFRLAAILQGIAKRAVDGTATDPGAAELGRKAAPISELAWATAQDSTPPRR